MCVRVCVCVCVCACVLVEGSHVTSSLARVSFSFPPFLIARGVSKENAYWILVFTTLCPETPCVPPFPSPTCKPQAWPVHRLKAAPGDGRLNETLNQLAGPANSPFCS